MLPTTIFREKIERKALSQPRQLWDCRRTNPSTSCLHCTIHRIKFASFHITERILHTSRALKYLIQNCSNSLPPKLTIFLSRPCRWIHPIILCSQWSGRLKRIWISNTRWASSYNAVTEQSEPVQIRNCIFAKLLEPKKAIYQTPSKISWQRGGGQSDELCLIEIGNWVSWENPGKTHLNISC